MMSSITQKRIPSLALLLAFNSAIALVLHFMVVPRSVFWETFIISQVTGFSISGCVSLGMRLGERHVKGGLGICIVLGLIFGIGLSGGINWMILGGMRAMGASAYYVRVFSYIAVFGLFFSIPIIYFFSSREKLSASEKRIQEEKIKRLTLEKESANTTLRLLQAQIEPHFLFNTLSSIQVLMDDQPDIAREMLTHLNQYLRISLDRTRQREITLGQELELVRRYLNIVKIRMGDRLKVTIQAPEALADHPFPPLILQPLVENAVQYGIEPQVEGGEIRIAAETTPERLILTVTDTGAGLDRQSTQAGIGINNVSQRLESLYGPQGRLQLSAHSPQGTQARVEVPL